MFKAEQFQELTKQYDEKQLQKTKRIQEDIKLVEDTLENLYIRIQNCIEKEITPPKYVEINKILEKPVSDDLILNQGFFLDITNDNHTRIYYNKNDFEATRKNRRINKTTHDKDKGLSKEQGNKLKEKLYAEQNNSSHTKNEFEENIIELLKDLFGDKEIKYHRGGF